jgi:hypothetical protein
MPGELRTPFFLIAGFCLVLIVLVELGSDAILRRLGSVAAVGAASVETLAARIPPAARPSTNDLNSRIQSIRNSNGKPPGFAIPYMAMTDELLLYSILLMALALVLPERFEGRLQGVLTLLVSLGIVILSYARIFIALHALQVMVTLLFATPFGPLVYLAIWGTFDRDGARATLSLLMFLKLAFAVLLILAHQRFLQNKGLVMMIVLSLLLNVVAAILIGIVPGFLASITDAIAGIVNAVAALILGIFFLFGSLIAVIKALRFDRALRRS